MSDNSDGTVVYGRFGMRRHHKTQEQMDADDARVAAVLAAVAAQTAEHEGHPRELIGRCTYCVPCGVRLGAT